MGRLLPTNRHLSPVIHYQPSRPDSVTRIHHELVIVQIAPSFPVYLGGIQRLDFLWEVKTSGSGTLTESYPWGGAVSVVSS